MAARGRSSAGGVALSLARLVPAGDRGSPGGPAGQFARNRQRREGLCPHYAPVENLGEAAAFSPRVKVEVYDSGGKTLLAEQTAYPVGQLLKNMAPKTSAAFEAIMRVPGGHESISWSMRADKYPFEIKDKSQ